jgi:hypothetical protein
VFSPGVNQTTQQITKEEYSGVISWASQDSIKIIDSNGVSRIFIIDESTQILKNDSVRARQRYTDLTMLDHVFISTLKNGTDEHATVIIIR